MSAQSPATTSHSLPQAAAHADARAEGVDLTALPRGERVRGLYVHVPFCFHKCHYCDFYSITRQTPERMRHFVGGVLTEARRWATDGPPLALETVFFGGGTPSLLPRDEMARLIDGLGETFDLAGVTEFTVEVNPATADADYMRMLARRGVGRVSVGAQSFEPAELAALERHHDPADVPRAIEMARDAGDRPAKFGPDLRRARPDRRLAAAVARRGAFDGRRALELLRPDLRT